MTTPRPASRQRPTTTRRRVETLIGHLEQIAALLDDAEAELADQEDTAAWGTNNYDPDKPRKPRPVAKCGLCDEHFTTADAARYHVDETGHDETIPIRSEDGNALDYADPTGTRFANIAPVISQRRRLNRAIQSAETAVVHLRSEVNRACGTASIDTSGERRCPEIVLEHDGSEHHEGINYINRACGALTHSWQRPDQSTAWRQDGRCIDHGNEHDRLAEASNARRQRRYREAS